MQSIASLPVSERFSETVVIHGFRDEIKDLKWSGFEKSKNFAAVAHNVVEGSEAFKTIDQLSPFARRNLTWLYGKNDVNQLPIVLKSAFLIPGYLKRKNFYQRLSSCRILLHPFNSPFHNHYTNIEAIASSIPTLLMDQNPLFLENGSEYFSHEKKRALGICTNIKEMTDLAENLYKDQFALNKLVTNQKFLLKPFSRENVNSEIIHFIKVLKKNCNREPSRSSIKIDGVLPSFLETKFDILLDKRKSFVDKGGNLPADLFIDFFDNRVDDFVIPSSEYLKPFSFGLPEQLYSKGLHIFEFALDGNGSIGLCIEVWHEGKVSRRLYYSGDLDGSESLRCTVNLVEQSKLIFFFGAVYNLPIKINRISHFLELSKTTDQKNPVNNLSLWGRVGQNIKTTFSSVCPFSVDKNKLSSKGFNLSESEKEQLILPEICCNCNNEILLNLTFFSKDLSEIKITFECWVDNSIQKNHQKMFLLKKGKSSIDLKIKDVTEFFIPVIYLESLSHEVYIQSFKISNEILWTRLN